MIHIKRAYEPADASDGHRVLVDRLWPRGIKKEAAHLDEWTKELAPSDALRKWFGHDPERFGEFEERYERELRSPEARAHLDALAERAEHEDVTLVYSAHDEEHNNAVVLARLIERLLERRSGASARGKTAARRRAPKAAARPASRATPATRRPSAARAPTKRAAGASSARTGTTRPSAKRAARKPAATAARAPAKRTGHAPAKRTGRPAKRATRAPGAPSSRAAGGSTGRPRRSPSRS